MCGSGYACRRRATIFSGADTHRTGVKDWLKKGPN